MGMVSTMVDGVETTTFPPLSSLPFFHWRTFALSFGSVAFLFCIHFLVHIHSPAGYHTTLFSCPHALA